MLGLIDLLGSLPTLSVKNIETESEALEQVLSQDSPSVGLLQGTVGSQLVLSLKSGNSIFCKLCCITVQSIVPGTNAIKYHTTKLIMYVYLECFLTWGNLYYPLAVCTLGLDFPAVWESFTTSLP